MHQGTRHLLKTCLPFRGRELELLEPPYRLAVAIFRDSIRAFAGGDYELARELKAKDRELYALTHGVSQRSGLFGVDFKPDLINLEPEVHEKSAVKLRDFKIVCL